MAKKAKSPRAAPMAVKIKGGILTISIGVETLKSAAERHEEFWLPMTDKYSMVVSDADRFAKDVLLELEREEEDGSTPVHLLLDKAIYQASEQGSEGLDYDAIEALEEAERKEASPVSEFGDHG